MPSRRLPLPQRFAELLFGSTVAMQPVASLQTQKPVIAAINGFALGGGSGLQSLIDITHSGEVRIP